MREIKFRAWGKPAQEWDKREGVMLYDFFLKSTGEFIESPFMKPEDVILMQFTGLKDKNGVDIYEGDIVADFDGDGPHSVVYFEDCFCLNRLEWDGKKRSPSNDEWWDTLEVIGNIYETDHPSLNLC